MNRASGSLKSYSVNDDAIVISATYPNEIYFRGVVDIRTIRGSVDIAGYEQTPEKSACTAYSIREYCVLKISLLKLDAVREVDKSCLTTLGIAESLAGTILSECGHESHLILVTKNYELQKAISCINFYFRPPSSIKLNMRKPLERLFFCDTSKNKNSRKYVDRKDWGLVYNAINDAAVARKRTPKVVLCGGKDAGKSTLLKRMANKSLRKWPEVLVLDFDPGQPEFSVMGSLSVAVVKEPLLGPNFSHLTFDKCLYFGDISVDNSVELYNSCVKHLVDYCQSSYSGIPWFINTMGYTTGLGVMLLGKIIELVEPTDIIQLQFERANGRQKNFPQRLTPDYLSTVDEKLRRLKYFEYELHVLPAFSHERGLSSGPYAASRRNMVTLAYFGQTIPNVGKGLLDVTPRKISANSVRIVVKKPLSQDIDVSLTQYQKLSCINANMVALCHTETEDRVVHIKGYGIVRGIDYETEEIYVITPLSDEELAEVEIIRISSTVQLPQEVHTSQVDHVRDHIPYLADRKSVMVNLCVKRCRKRKAFSAETFNFDMKQPGQPSSSADL